jgi:hypothetical protein
VKVKAADFFVNADVPLQQGDVLLAGVARYLGPDQFTPGAWQELEPLHADLEDDGWTARLAAGPCLVMATSHDCHFDKQWNQRRKDLIADGLSEAEAEEIASNDPELDRTFQASPLVRPELLGVDLGNLMAGRMVGYLPVPASSDGRIPEAVIDLTYRCTLDRADVVRVSSVTDSARARLRQSLAHLDALRSTTLGFTVEEVLGRSIARVELPSRDPLVVRLHLDDGTVIDLFKRPAEPAPTPARTA